MLHGRQGVQSTQTAGTQTESNHQEGVVCCSAWRARRLRAGPAASDPSCGSILLPGPLVRSYRGLAAAWNALLIDTHMRSLTVSVAMSVSDTRPASSTSQSLFVIRQTHPPSRSPSCQGSAAVPCETCNGVLNTWSRSKLSKSSSVSRYPTCSGASHSGMVFSSACNCACSVSV